MVRPAETAGRNAGTNAAVSDQGSVAADGITQVALGAAGLWDWSCKLQPLDLRRFPVEPSQVHQALRQSLRFLASTEIPKPGQYLPVSGARILLPPELPHHRGRMTLVLDLDETLIHCVKSPTEDRLAAESPPDLCIRFSDGAVKGSIRFRPYTKVFLEVVSNLFEVVVFTASTQAYADTVLDTLDPSKKWITHRLYRPSCTLSPSGGYFKDLSLLGRPLDKVILVDNSPTSLAMQPDNGIPVRTWQDDMKDREMIDLISVLHSCRNSGNVRNVLRTLYRFDEFLQKLRYQDEETAALLQRYGEC
jgi:CTD small phosphatase-like protein 2